MGKREFRTWSKAFCYRDTLWVTKTVSRENVVLAALRRKASLKKKGVVYCRLWLRGLHHYKTGEQSNCKAQQQWFHSEQLGDTDWLKTRWRGNRQQTNMASSLEKFHFECAIISNYIYFHLFYFFGVVPWESNLGCSVESAEA